MTERERLALKAFRDEEAERQRIEQERREKPVKQATELLNSVSREIYNTVRQRIATLRDDQFTLDPETTKPLPAGTNLADWQREEAERFKRGTPGYWPTPENEQVIVDYINRNHPGIRRVSARQLQWAYVRLSEYRLLTPRPEPEPVPEPAQAEIEPPQTEPPATPELDGVDPSTGQPRRYTAREVDRMSAETYRRTFQLIGDRRPRLIDARP